MPVSLTIARVDHLPGDIIRVETSSGASRDFGGLSDIQAFANGVDINEDTLWRILMANWLENSPDASNDNAIEGVTLTYDPAQNLAVMQKS